MKKRQRNCYSLAAGVALSLVLASSHHAPAGELGEKARKYLEVLERRPSPGYLFDRFYSAWLETASVEDLEMFLVEGSKEREDATYELLLAFLYERNGASVKALKRYQHAAEREPGSARILYHKGNLEASTLDFEQALKNLEAARAAQPEGTLREDVLKLLGKVHIRNGQAKQGLAVWQQLLTAAEDDDDLREEIIELELEEGLFQEALAGCEELAKLTEDKYRAVMVRLRMGDIYRRLDRKEKALEASSSTLAQVGRGCPAEARAALEACAEGLTEAHESAVRLRRTWTPNDGYTGQYPYDRDTGAEIAEALRQLAIQLGESVGLLGTAAEALEQVR